MFRITVLLHKPSVLQLEVTKSRSDILLQDFLAEFMVPLVMEIRPGAKAAKKPRTIILPPRLPVDIMFFL